MRIAIVLVAAAAVLSGCSFGREPARSTRTAAAAPAPRRSVEANEAVWHLRVGLNVAALMCKGRGRIGVAGDYSRLLDRHRSLLSAAYRDEQRRHGGGFERHQTRLYNRFANQRDLVGFCRTASGVAKRAVALDSSGLASNAGRLVAEID